MSGRLYDVVICGGGPAGCAAAAMLAQGGRRVALLERTQYVGWRPGEALSPEVNPLLKTLEIFPVMREAGHLHCHGVTAWWGGPDASENDYLFLPWQNGWLLDRARFDFDLSALAARAGAEVFTGTEVHQARIVRGQWAVTFLRAGQAEEICGAFLVRATGRPSARNGGGAVRMDKLCALVRVGEDLEPSGAIAPRIFVEAHPLGWWYCVAVPGRRVTVSFFTDHDLLPRKNVLAWWDVHLAEARNIHELVSNIRWTSGIHLRSAATVFQSQSAGQSFACLGDAALAIDPLSGSGVTHALEDAMDLCRQLLQSDERSPDFARRRRDRLREALERHRLWSRAYYGREQRWPDSPFWGRRHSLERDSAIMTPQSPSLSQRMAAPNSFTQVQA